MRSIASWQLELAERGRSAAETLRADADRELAERRSVEHALRSSETRYRALAARTSRLHALSAALSEAVTMEAVARAVITHGRVVVGATAGEVLLLVDEGTQLDTLHAEADGHHDAGAARVPVEDGLCATAAVKTGLPVFITSLEDWQQRFWRSASVAADGGYQSSATMPLLVEGAPAGVLTFHFTVPVNFDDEYQALLLSVAQHCAQALDRARLYESTQRARADAELANRIKDEFVSIVSHELRTPLNAILGWTDMLQRGVLAPEKSARALQSIHDNASRQARLIEELLDFSRVSSGRTSLQIEPVDVREMIRGVVESMIPTAVARAVDLQLSPVPPVVVRGDVRRLEQVCFNLIDNALKFTPEGGRVAIDVRLDRGQVEIEVKDTGAGMDPEFLPYVFDRFRQADSTTSRTHGGLGLGLSIAQATGRGARRHDRGAQRRQGRGLGVHRAAADRRRGTRITRGDGPRPAAGARGRRRPAARRPPGARRGRRGRRARHHGGRARSLGCQRAGGAGRARRVRDPRAGAGGRAALGHRDARRGRLRVHPEDPLVGPRRHRVDPGGGGHRLHERRGSGARARRRVSRHAREAVRARAARPDRRSPRPLRCRGRDLVDPHYCFFKYATSAARSDGSGCRSKLTPSVVATGGGGPGGAVALMNLNSSI